MFRKLSDETASARGVAAKAVSCELLEDRRMMSVTATEVAIPTSGSHPQAIFKASDGNGYFAEEGARQLGVITPSGTITEYAVLGTGQPKTVTQGSDGNIYIAQTDGITIWSPRYKRSKTFLSLPSGGGATDIISASDGTLWFTEINNAIVGQLVPKTQKFTEYSTPTAGSQPYIIYQDSVGAFWFSEQNANKIGHIVKHKGTLKIVELPISTANSDPAGITQGANGYIYFAEYSANKIGIMNNNTGAMTDYDVPLNNDVPSPDSPAAAPIDVLTGSDGNVYFDNNLGGVMGSITSAGVVTEYDVLPTKFSGPVLFSTGPSTNTFWVPEYAGNNIAIVNYAAAST